MAAVDGQVAKRRRIGEQKHREDRVSSLPDDVLLRILSYVPLKLAVLTGRLSRRWQGLWTNLTCIKISIHYKKYNYKKLFTFFDKIMKGITSPFVETFIVNFFFITEGDSGWSSLNYLDSWLHRICDRNVRELKVISRGPLDYVFRLPSYIFQTRSLISLELDTLFGWQLPDDGPDLPNLKKLSINVSIVERKWLEKLVEACMSLEELSIKSEVGPNRDRYFKCSNNNVTRLILMFGYGEHEKVVINTPKLEYLSVRGSKYNLFSFEEEPIALREAKFIVNYHYPLKSTGSVFPYVTRLTLDMGVSYDFKFVLAVVKSCPVLDVLTLQFLDIGEDRYHIAWPVCGSTPLRGIKRIKIETCWKTYRRPKKYFLKFVKYLLRKARDVEHFRFKVVGEDSIKGGVKRKQKRELNMCKRLYKYPIVSTMGCEVEFFGRFFNMSRKGGPKAWRPNGEVIPFDPNTIFRRRLM